ncbi:28S ribosomal protein S18a, mitochondrial [Diabrotica virgifera virgifera]|uniref:28S ribosomal protein S18a, mitochondrial n=1 Tax=Diabrotica virgifera virgifera TaxID=50390 RepID=A0A6P7GIQ5_DIAVI|nr:28S ribosomal protein S18a, mitochondrial [Diabrotica virgifera virgifera]
MNLLLKQIKNIRLDLNSNIKNFSIFPALRLKEIQEIQNDKELIISAKHVPSGRESYLLKNDHPTACSVCASGLDIKHTDVLILSQFVRTDGCMLPKRITGLCSRSQKRIATLVAMAQKSGLMPNLTPGYSHKDPKKRYRWKRYNKYFDESTIKIR